MEYRLVKVLLILTSNAVLVHTETEVREHDRIVPANYTPTDPVEIEFYKKLKDKMNNPKEGDVNLIGGNVPWEGHPVIYHDGKWASICQDGFDYPAASVVCKQLGFKGAHLIYMNSRFPGVKDDFWLDDIDCFGNETSITNCLHASWGVHDCDHTRGAGVRCTHQIHWQVKENISHDLGLSVRSVSEAEYQPSSNSKLLRRFSLKLVGGRNNLEGRVMIRFGTAAWGNICGLGFGLFEANQVCKALGKHYAHSAFQDNIFFDDKSDGTTVIASGMKCSMKAKKLNECTVDQVTNCPAPDKLAGVMCTDKLPDLYPDLHLLRRDFYLEERYLFYLQCAMEENCVAPSAYEVQKKSPDDWHYNKRRLIRFTTAIWNNGTTDFFPTLPKYAWIWHLCHAHYHSMEVFARYEIFTLTGEKLREATKASFCLEDNNCVAGRQKKFQCRNFGDQGISPGCVDTYFHDVDCQWIDITDMDPGSYRFQACLNPDYLVAEITFENNCAACRLTYTGYSAYITNCSFQEPW